MQSLDAAAARAFRDDSTAEFRSQGLSLTIKTNLAAWYDEFRQAEPGAYFTPSFNPAYVDLRMSEFLGGLIRRGPVIVARSAIRLVVTDDLLRDELASMRLWQTRPGPLEQLKSMVAAPRLPTIHGRTCHEGCTWVAPSHRRRGVASRLVSTMRALALLKWEPNWIFGFLRPEVQQSGVAERTYGYQNLTLILSGYLPVTRRDVTVYLSYMTSREAVLVMRTQRTNQTDRRRRAPSTALRPCVPQAT